MKLVLYRFKDDGSARTFTAKGDTIVIGRDPSCELRVPGTQVSRQHCKISIESDAIYVQDMGSSNGTYRNDTKVTERVLLEPGDRLSLGEIVFTVQIDDVPEHVEPPLLESPAILEKQTRPRDESSMMDAPKDKDPGESDGDLSDLIASMSEDGSSAFEFDIDEDEL
ncbi:MAG: FHA domain-containing protein [Phycisphaerales bacterium JB043]